MLPLRVLVVDDELPVREELGYLLARDSRVGEVATTGSGAEALKHLEREETDVVFLDIAMPGLSGLDVARVLARFVCPLPIVFVTAHEAHAVEAFEINAVDYLLKPVRAERVDEAVRRIVANADQRSEPADDETVPVELAGVTRFLHRSDIGYVEAHGDYVRLHTADGSHLLRIALTTLEERWRDAGFVRIHRSSLVALSHVSEVRLESGRCTVVVGDVRLPVSRRHTPELRDVLVRRSSPRVDKAN